MPLSTVKIEPAPWYNKFHTTVDVLRLDRIHPLISGNKWFKIRFYLEEALALRKTALLTFGGTYSNHILATAAVAREAGLHSIGLIRGGEGPVASPTLEEAAALGMKLYFTDRGAYREQTVPPAVYEAFEKASLYRIPEGGYGLPGARGAATILQNADSAPYTHIVAAAGTGTMLAGLSQAAAPHQKVVGISVLRGHHGLDAAVAALGARNVQTVHGYHCGGYAKKTPELLQFMNAFFTETGIPTDFVYTAKLFYAVDALFREGFFNKNDRLLVIHSGGLQGNRSLPKGTLIF